MITYRLKNNNRYYEYIENNNINEISLYNNIVELYIIDYPFLAFCKLPDKLPLNIVKLSAINCNLMTLPEKLPYTLEYINITRNNIVSIPWIPIDIKYFNGTLNMITCNGIFNDTKKLFASIYNKYLHIVDYNNINGYDTMEFDAINLDGNPITFFYLSTNNLLEDWLKIY